MPRKYRPPAARRRKAKRQAPFFVEPVPEATPADGGAGDGAVEVAVEDVESKAPEVVEERVSRTPVKAERQASGQVRHIARDYSYVRAEIRRIALIGGLLIVALIITAILRG